MQNAAKRWGELKLGGVFRNKEEKKVGVVSAERLCNGDREYVLRSKFDTRKGGNKLKGGVPFLTKTL